MIEMSSTPDVVDDQWPDPYRTADIAVPLPRGVYLLETFENKILDIMAEFGDQPEQCLSIIGELIGERQHFRRHPNAPRTEEL